MPADEADPRSSVQLSLDGFEGPLDLLLELARRQAVDLRRVSVASLVDQYLAATADIGRVGLTLAADWLVMAAWLVWLKSRLLLPKNPEEAQEAEAAARVLTDRLQALGLVRAATAWLERRPQLGRDMFGPGRQDQVAPVQLRTGIVDLLQAALTILKAGLTLDEQDPYRPARPRLWTPHQAMARMRQLRTRLPDGSDLLQFVPKLSAEGPDPVLRTRASVASTLVASLELARACEVKLQQDRPFGPILVYASEEASNDREADSPADLDA